MSPARLECRGLRVERGPRGARRTILRDVDVCVAAGEVLGVLGPSGAGKSTLFRALSGEEPPDAGTVLLDGIDVTRWPLWKRARAKVGYIPQGPSVLWEDTVRANLLAFSRIALGGEARRAAMRDGAVSAAAAKVALADRLDVRAGALSGGERRRLELARATIASPRVLLCDEPFAGIDPKGAHAVGDLLLGLAMEGVAVILADHHVAEALRVCTRAVLLLDGTIAAQAAPTEFAEHPLVRGRYL
jgi:lipopolysaccharide export system ATP-binding protein